LVLRRDRRPFHWGRAHRSRPQVFKADHQVPPRTR